MSNQKETLKSESYQLEELDVTDNHHHHNNSVDPVTQAASTSTDTTCHNKACIASGQWSVTKEVQYRAVVRRHEERT